ncbi:MAG: pyrroline-5-carboxylate reductase [Erythrobacter sp. 34-65-8]|nr:MAG: pyrroline-5-carboxylate reductase [Erythrobacter sp. 34-65-8]
MEADIASTPILLFGYGNMAAAMLEGWLASGMAAEDFAIYNPRLKPAPAGVRFCTAVPQGPFATVVLGVKPQMLDAVAPQLEPLLGPETMLVSILAGVELASLRQRFPRAGGIVRLMPNLAVALRKSPNALVGQRLSPPLRDKVTALAAALGSAEWLDDESQFELVTALAGSGPGFLFRFIEALAKGAAALGLEPDQAGRLAVAMVEGAGALAAGSPHSPAELARRVASPGGMTQRGYDVLDRGEALDLLVRDTLRAARDRGEEMARAARGEG